MSRLITRRSLAGSLVSFALALTPLAAAYAQATFEIPPVSDNAALQYWQAFGMLPALDAEQEALLENWDEAPLDDATLKLLEQGRVSLMYLRRGAKLTKCDWGLDYNDGVYLYLPHLAKARSLARLAALDARRAFAAEEWAVGREDVTGMMALGRHASGDLTLVSILVGYAIEATAIDVLTPVLPELVASDPDAVSMFESLPPPARLDQAVLAEKRMALGAIKMLKDAEQKRQGSWREQWINMASPEVPDVIRNIDEYDDAIRLMEEFLAVYDELSQLVALPASEFDAQFPAFAERARAANPVAELLLPAMDKVAAAQRRGEARMAMLLAAIAVVESGPEKLQGIDDPFGEGPFEYEELASGFELRSGLTADGKAVTLVVGQRD